MLTVNIQEAKTQLSRYVDQAAAGEEVTIARAGACCTPCAVANSKNCTPAGFRQITLSVTS